MGAILSPAREKWLLLKGLKLVNRGKVRDTYDLGNNLLLIVATDAISIFDFVLNALVPFKGIVLNLMSHFWLKMLEGHGFRTHLVAAGTAIDEYLPESLRHNPDLQARAMVVKKMKVHPYEFIYRNVLTGSSKKPYNETGMVCGVKLPPGLQDGDLLPRPIFTPTTKAEVGHDENVDAEDIRRQFPEETYQGLSIFLIAIEYARKCGILLADTKFEFGLDENGNIILVDEALTADSSRFWELAVWKTSRQLEKRKAPPPFDKQVVRNKGLELEINKLEPTSEKDCQFVWGCDFPPELFTMTTKIYRYIFWRLTGQSIEDYAKKVLGINLPRPRKNIAILLGSDSDINEAVENAVKTARIRFTNNGELGDINVHVMSCHRNTPELIKLAANEDESVNLDEIDFFIGGAGMAAQLPGMLEAMLYHNGRDIPVIGLGFGQEQTDSLLAAKLSIEQLPGQPVILDELTGKAYTNAEGLTAIFERLATGELPPPKSRKKKKVKYNVI